MSNNFNVEISFFCFYEREKRAAIHGCHGDKGGTGDVAMTSQHTERGGGRGKKAAKDGCHGNKGAERGGLAEADGLALGSGILGGEYAAEALELAEVAAGD